MNKISESIFTTKNVVIPMADVQHIEKQYHQYNSENGNTKIGDFSGAFVITKHSKWNFEIDTWENSIRLNAENAKKFLEAWCFYRYELEGGKDAFKSPKDHPLTRIH